MVSVWKHMTLRQLRLFDIEMQSHLNLEFQALEEFVFGVVYLFLCKSVFFFFFKMTQ